MMVILIIATAVSLALNVCQWIALSIADKKIKSENYILDMDDEFLTSEQIAKKKAILNQKEKPFKYKIVPGGLSSTSGKIYNWTVTANGYNFYFNLLEDAQEKVRLLEKAERM